MPQRRNLIVREALPFPFDFWYVSVVPGQYKPLQRRVWRGQFFAFSQPNAHPYSLGFAHPDTNTRSDTHTNAYPLSHPDTRSDANAHSGSYSYSYSYSYPNAKPDTDTHSVRI